MLKTSVQQRGVIVRRIVAYVFGLFMLAFGVGLSVKSNLGISPVNAVPYVVSQLSGLEQGMLTTIFFCFLILLQVLLLRKAFKPVQLLQVVCSTLFGSFVTLANWLLSPVVLTVYWARLAFALLSIVFIAAGMTLYLCANLIPQPTEGLCLAIEKLYGFQYGNIKVCVDCSMVAAAAVISLIGCHTIIGLREGTVLTMLCAGKLIGLMMRLFNRSLKAWIYQTTNP